MKRVLVIEGDPDAATLFKLHLGKYVGEIMFASDVEEALSLIAPRPPEVIIAGCDATFYNWRKVKDLVAGLGGVKALYCATVDATAFRRQLVECHAPGSYAVVDLPTEGYSALPNALRVAEQHSLALACQN